MTTIAIKDKLITRLFAPLIISFLIILSVLSFYISSITRDNAIDTAISSAELTVKQYKIIRGYYTKNIIKKYYLLLISVQITVIKMTQTKSLYQQHLFTR